MRAFETMLYESRQVNNYFYNTLTSKAISQLIIFNLTEEINNDLQNKTRTYIMHRFITTFNVYAITRPPAVTIHQLVHSSKG